MLTSKRSSSAGALKGAAETVVKSGYDLEYCQNVLGEINARVKKISEYNKLARSQSPQIKGPRRDFADEKIKKSRASVGLHYDLAEEPAESDGKYSPDPLVKV